MDLLPILGQREAIVSRSGPHLATGAGNVGSGTTEETQRKSQHQDRCAGFAASGLIVDLDQREASTRRDDFLKVGDHKRQGDGEREG